MPQWMNIPNLASRHHFVRLANCSCVSPVSGFTFSDFCPIAAVINEVTSMAASKIGATGCSFRHEDIGHIPSKTIWCRTILPKDPLFLPKCELTERYYFGDAGYGRCIEGAFQCGIWRWWRKISYSIMLVAT